MKRQLSIKKTISYKIIPIFMFAVMAMLYSPASASEADDIVERIQETFSGIKDIKGNFSQSSYIKDIEQTQNYSGTFFIKKPARMMWEYANPRDEKIIIKDLDTWIYKKSLNQVIKTRFSKETYSQVPLALLGSFENIRTDFNISLTEENALQLVPKHKIGFIKTLVMETAPKGFPIKMFTIIDTYGNIIMIELNKVETNPGLKDSLFDFRVPDGAEVIDLNQ